MSRFVRYLPLAIGSLAFLIATSSAFADRFQDLDSNQDGVLSGSEAQWLISFDTEPVGKPDGEVTRKEFSAGLARFLKTPINPEERFQARNTNRDDRLSGTELSGYEYTDLDGNGRVTQKEFAEGLQRDQAKRATMPIEELTAEGKRRFDGLDLNRDQRLSGLEMTGMATADFNNDRRLSLEEFMASLLLDTANEPTSVPPASRTASENPLQTVINAVNRHDGSAIYAMFRPELAQIVDAVLFEYVVGFVAQSHGTLAMPSKDLITVNDQGLNGKKLVSLKPRCQKGKLEIELTVLTNQLLGIAFNSPEIDQLNDHLFSDLFADKDGLLGKFAQAYSSQCTLMIQHVLDAKFSDAYAMLHPEVQEKIGLDRFTVVFQRLREICGDDPTKIELETAGVELDAQGKGVFFTISHRVTGSQGTALFQHKMQFVGLKAHFVAVSVESAPDEAVPPPAPPVPAPPVPASPVPAPPVLAPTAIPPSPIGAAPPPFSDVIAPPK